MPEARSTLADGVTIAPTVRPKRVAETPPSTIVVPPRARAPASAWSRALAGFAIAFAALLAIYVETLLDLWNEWGATGTYAHGYFIFPISAWLVWRARHALEPIAPKAQPLALVPLAGCCLLWLAAHSANVHVITQLAFIAMFPCMVWAVFGNAVTRAILYPLGFLFFAVPFGDFLMPTLMDHTANFTVAALRLSGVPVFREGNYFSIPSGNWSVVEACSGLRYLIASLTLGVLFAYLNYRAAWRRAAFIVAALLVPIVANWMRAYLIVMIAHLSSNKLATGVDHLIYGWLFFGLVMLLLFWVGNLWRDDDTTPTSPATPAGHAPRAHPLRTGSVVAITAAAIAVAAPWPAIGDKLESIADAANPGAIAIDSVAGWEPAEDFTRFVPHFEKARVVENRTFASGDRAVDLFVGYYSGQQTNGPLVTYGNAVVVVSDKVWGSVAQQSRTVTVGDKALAVVENKVRSETPLGSERLLTWRWYWINGRLTTNDYVAKAWNAIDKLTGRGDDSAVIVVTTKMNGPVDASAEATLEAFVKAAEPTIAARLASVHGEARR